MDVFIYFKRLIYFIVVLQKVSLRMPGRHIVWGDSDRIVKVLAGQRIVGTVHQIAQYHPGLAHVRISFDSGLKCANSQIGFALVAIDHTQHKECFRVTGADFHDISNGAESGIILL